MTQGDAARALVQSSGIRSVYQLHVQIQDVHPPVWRRIWVRGNFPLGKLSRVFQVTMGWLNGHVHAYHIGAWCYGRFGARPRGERERDERHFDLALALVGGTREFLYTYDAGCEWRHLVHVEAVLKPDDKNIQTVCVAGQNACPPENVGGPSGYSDFLRAMSDVHHPDHASQWAWNEGPFDPAGFDLNAVNATIRRLGLL